MRIYLIPQGSALPGTILYLFSQKMELDPYNIFRNATITHVKLMNNVLPHIFKKIRSGISILPNLRNPWIVKVKCGLHPETFFEIFRAVRDFRNIGVKCLKMKDKKGVTKSYKIDFIYINAFTTHIKHLSNGKLNARTFMKKTLRNECKGEIYATEEKPIKMTYKINTGICEITLPYKVTNQYNVIVSD